MVETAWTSWSAASLPPPPGAGRGLRRGLGGRQLGGRAAYPRAGGPGCRWGTALGAAVLASVCGYVAVRAWQVRRPAEGGSPGREGPGLEQGRRLAECGLFARQTRRCCIGTKGPGVEGFFGRSWAGVTTPAGGPPARWQAAPGQPIWLRPGLLVWEGGRFTSFQEERWPKLWRHPPAWSSTHPSRSASTASSAWPPASGSSPSSGSTRAWPATSRRATPSASTTSGSTRSACTSGTSGCRT